jgi:2,3,4,5-tetrahydropyridine-2,6-dicarboxylate N-succinyltransferase
MSSITTVEDFRSRVASIEGTAGYGRPAAFAVGLATVAPSGKVLDTSYPLVNVDENYGSAAILSAAVDRLNGTSTHALEAGVLDEVLASFAPFMNDGQPHPNIDALRLTRATLDTPDPLGGTRRAVVAFIGALSDAPVDVSDVYLRLHLLSTRKVKPHGVNLDGLFGFVNNVVWTNRGPFDPDGFDMRRLELKSLGIDVFVDGIDKFPCMTDYVIPSGVRIANAGRVRLGAHLSEGTTVMHEGFCNFNAGTLGSSMVEGRISAGVVVGDGSDIGGGASIMGTLSGGGKKTIVIGERCLLGANAGIGISLGNDCVVEAGCYVTAGTLVKLPDGGVVKARDLSGMSNLLFRRNSQSGAIEAIANKAEWGGLNAQLHKN